MGQAPRPGSRNEPGSEDRANEQLASEDGDSSPQNQEWNRCPSDLACISMNGGFQSSSFPSDEPDILRINRNMLSYLETIYVSESILGTQMVNLKYFAFF